MALTTLQRSHPAAPTVVHQPTFLGRVAIAVLAHRRWVLGFWLVMLLMGGAAAGAVSNRLSVDFSLPGQPGYETSVKILSIYHNGGDNPPSVAVVTVPPGQSIRADQAGIEAAFAGLRRAEPALRVVDYGVTHDSAFVTANGRSTFALLFEPPAKSFGADHVANAAQSYLQKALPGTDVGLTGLDQLAAGSSSKGPGVLTETLLGGAGALAVLAFVFASFMALVPLAVAAVSILSTLLIILGLTYITEVSFIVQFLVALVGLGVAIDYSLLLVTRWREERARGASNHDAVVTAVETAGRAVVLSGLTVTIGLAALVVLPVPGLRSVGIGGMLIPLVSIVVVNTLLPAVLGGIGPRVDWPHVRQEARASRAWSAWAAQVTKRRFLATAVALGALALAVVPVFGLKVGETSVSAFSKIGPARAAYDTLVNGGVPGGVLTPLEVLTSKAAGPVVAHRLSGAPASPRPCSLRAHGQPGRHLGHHRHPEGRDGQQPDPGPGPGGGGGRGPFARSRRCHGRGPVEQDYSHAVFGHFPLMFGLIAIITFLLLARAFRSPLLAAKAVVLNLLSLGATFGLLTWFWQEGHGSQAIFSIPATGAITFWVPLMVFAFLFGLSMDYEVFILTRIREEYDHSGSTRGAVVEGLGRTGRLVTCAALILFLAFASLASAPDTDIKVLATGLGAGILLDATVVRGLLVPALVAVFGRWNWWLPDGLRRALLLPAESRPVG